MPSRPKPSHHAAAYGAWFRDPLVAQAYPTRPPYPDQVISLLVSLVRQAQDGAGAADMHDRRAPRNGRDGRVGSATTVRVLDLGAGTGDLARRLAPLVGRVDAVDASEAMVKIGRQLPGGDHPHIRWALGMAEEAPLDPPYALATAGESLHWMDWDVVLPRVARSLAPGGVLAIVSRSWENPPTLRDRMLPLFERYSPVKDYRPYDMIAELAARGLFAEAGRQRCGPAPWTPTIAEYVECRHLQRSCSRTHMGAEAADAFDRDLTALLEELVRDGTIQEQKHDGRLQLSVTSSVTWGRPLPGPAAG